MKHLDTQRVDDHCFFCGRSLQYKFSKNDRLNTSSYDIYCCSGCRHWQIWPVPNPEELTPLYGEQYFQKRTSRGYDNYDGDFVCKSILSTLKKNLEQLGFYIWEEELKQTNKKCMVLDIGCASGHFLQYLKDRSWVTEGIDISLNMVKAAQKKGLNVRAGDFLETEYPTDQYDLVTLWATLEHLAEIEKILFKCFTILKPQGHLYLSTCHLGFWAKVQGTSWRFLNVPEHIWYFSRRLLRRLAQKTGFTISKQFTYGSGFTGDKNASRTYQCLKKLADYSAKTFYSGDMIVCDLLKDH